jgi:hypothetical protein
MDSKGLKYREKISVRSTGTSRQNWCIVEGKILFAQGGRVGDYDFRKDTVYVYRSLDILLIKLILLLGLVSENLTVTDLRILK